MAPLNIQQSVPGLFLTDNDADYCSEIRAVYEARFPLRGDTYVEYLFCS